jgi:hypothetical protein
LASGIGASRNWVTTVVSDLQYLNELTESVRGSLRAGRTLEEALAGNSLAPHYLPPAQSPFAQLTPFLVGLHRWNVQRTYQEMSGR